MDRQDILDNVDGRMHGPMSGFIKRFFGKFQYICQDGVLRVLAAERALCSCRIPSPVPAPGAFIHWFSYYVSQSTEFSRGSWHFGQDNTSPEHKNDVYGTCIMLSTPTSSPDSERETRWNQVQVVGQVQPYDRHDYRDGLLRLCHSVQQIFASQPTRLFLHGFYIRGSLLELWIFDRSGLYCSEVLNTETDFVQVLSILLSYKCMTDLELGNSNILQTDKNGSYVILDSAPMALGKLYLDTQPIASREGLVGTGTTCYRARVPDSSQWTYVVKFKWRWARHRPEDELLRLAKDRGVWGAISLDYYQELESTAKLRRGIRWAKHRRFTTNTSSMNDVENHEVSTNSDGLVNHTEETEDYFQNRILTCVVTSPVGRPLHTFRSLMELLRVFGDAIKCHRSLYEASILHQDVSLGNMIILDTPHQEASRGMLIDFDSAIELNCDDDSESERGIVGTRPFMAIGVMQSERHSYRHDIESFFYVFIWMMVTNRAEDPPATSKLRQWSRGTWDELAVRKSLDMTEQGFQQILLEFDTEFHCLKPTAEKMREILFPLRNGTLWTGTDSCEGASDELYNAMIEAFEEAV